MSSLGDFLQVMYKKRELEYKAKTDQAAADVAGAQAIGKGIQSFGEAAGAIGQGIGGYMQGKYDFPGSNSPTNQFANQFGERMFGKENWMGGGTKEMEMRKYVGQFDANQGMTPYQSANLELGNRRLEAYIKRGEDIVNAGKEAKSKAAAANESKAFTQDIADMDSYQARSDENLTKMYAADDPQVFDTHRKHQISLNESALKRGFDPTKLAQVPSEFIPPRQRKAYQFYQYQQQFGLGTTNPQEMARRRAEAAIEGSTDTGDPATSYGTGPGQVRPPTMSTGVPTAPPGSKYDPNFGGPKGSTANKGSMVYDGQFWVPKQFYK